MLDVLRKENPAVVEQMLAEGALKGNEDKKDDVMEEDLTNDQSLEAKIEREVKKNLKVVEKTIQIELDKQIETTVKLVGKLNDKNNKTIITRADATDGYIQEVHKFQIDEMKNFKTCHD